MKIATTIHNTTHLTLSTLIHYLGKLNIRIFCRYLADVVENANKYAFKQCTFWGEICYDLTKLQRV